MSRVGGRRSVSFPIIRDGVKADPAEVPENPNPIVVWRNLFHDNQVIQGKLEDLGRDQNAIHGDLRVILSALRRMTARVQALLENEESAPS